ncbi:MAG: tRNA pseudouridine(54/55) synthase Pus10 [Candidatus Lokiarchaeota archaeon]|nr:tRNA pseudouridine(54/55) synthase Pus10 [Candidatus Lokiarchaeota archaeon]
MSIFEKVLEIYANRYLCKPCLGRMFSLLGTNTTNEERASSLLLSITMENHQKLLSGTTNEREIAVRDLKILAQNANYATALKILKKEGIEFSQKNTELECYLCKNIFNNLEDYAQKAQKKLSDFEFDTLLVGTSPEAEIVNKEDKFKSKLQLIEAESFKSHFNREVGKILSEKLKKEPEFQYPDITIIYTVGYDSCSIRLLIRSLFIYGRYKKLIRGIPQTKWPCGKCNGKGCEECDFTGKQYQTSVEELISPAFIRSAQAEGSKFHGAGREDIDVRMLGSGRPFVLELINPKVRSLDLEAIRRKVNSLNEGKVEINELRYSDKKEVVQLKEEAENTQKTYKALVRGERNVDESTFQEKMKLVKDLFEEEILDQRTPNRVSHRRADKIRKKRIYKIEGVFLEPDLYEFIIKTQGGTYIKELINGDEGRTSPSLTEIFDMQLVCEELEVINIEY